MSELIQYKCPLCEQYRRLLKSGHGLIVHLFHYHLLDSDQIQGLLRDMKLEAVGSKPWSENPDWWDSILDGEG